MEGGYPIATLWPKSKRSIATVLVDTDAGITGIGQGGSPDTVRKVSRSVIGKNAFDTEFIWQAAFMDGQGRGAFAFKTRLTNAVR